MKLGLDPDLGHLTYCTNIHPGESWPELYSVLSDSLPQIKAKVSPKHSLGVGLRLSAQAAFALSEPEAMRLLKVLLAKDFYVFTLNGFPYGQFHAEPVKQNVYRPDWRDTARLDYTNCLADILSQLLPPGMEGSISTLPGSYRPWVEQSGNQQVFCDDIARNLLRHVAHLYLLERRTGQVIRLALEPEPFCLFERSIDVSAFFYRHLLTQAAFDFLSLQTGCTASESESLIRRYLGVCLDVCHHSVVFEDPLLAVRHYQDTGIYIAKCQLSTALHVQPANRAQRSALKAFDDEIYLHQTYVSRDDTIQAFSDLGEALQGTDETASTQWRCHFHVPVFLGELENFKSTQTDLIELLRLHKEQPFCSHLEVETYTWDVLPMQYRDTPVTDAIARELNWVLDKLR